jgi:hypothetical protein
MEKDYQTVGIKVLLIMMLFIAFCLTGLAGFAFTAGLILGDLITEKLF